MICLESAAEQIFNKVCKEILDVCIDQIPFFQRENILADEGEIAFFLTTVEQLEVTMRFRVINFHTQLAEDDGKIAVDLDIEGKYMDSHHSYMANGESDLTRVGKLCMDATYEYLDLCASEVAHAYAMNHINALSDLMGITKIGSGAPTNKGSYVQRI